MANIIGLTPLCKELDAIKTNGEKYRTAGVKVPHFIMNLKKENGQSFVAKYIAEELYDNGLRSFCGIEMCLEYEIDGSKNQLSNIFEDIRSNAVYTNEYYGVIAFDVSKLSQYLNEYQLEYFLTNLKRVSEFATIIIYCDTDNYSNGSELKNIILSELKNCIDVVLSPYSKEDYAKMVIQNIEDRGIEVETSTKMLKSLGEVINVHGISRARETALMADKLLSYADYSNCVPKIGVKEISSFVSSEKKSFA